MQDSNSTEVVKDLSTESINFDEVGTPVAHILLPAQTYRDVGTYSLVYDAATWEDDRREPKDPQPFLEMTTCIDDGTLQFTCTFPFLDAIRDATCAELRKSGPVPLEPQIYRCTDFIAQDTQSVCYRIEMINPNLLALYADDADPKDLKYTNLSFKRLGLGGTILFLFSIMEVEMSYNGAELTAFVRKYDPDVVGGAGNRHIVTGTWSGVSSNITSTQVVAEAAAVQNNIFFALDSNFTSRIASQSTSGVFSGSVPEADKNGAEKLSGLDLSLEKLEGDTQSLIHNAMLYHMDENQRKYYTGQNRPRVGNFYDEVPIELGPNLNQPTADWLKKKYIPMWIANCIMCISDEKVANWHHKFSTAERKRIRYWWTGSGKKFMSQEPYYCRLNEMCSRIATLRVVPELKDYMNDTNRGSAVATVLSLDTKGLTRGKRWAAALYNYHRIGPGLAQLAQKSGEKKLQKICTLMQTLDPVPLKLLPGESPLQEQPLSINL